jgi:hypothetical protein
VTVGSDSNNGTSTATPWLTIAHVNAQTFNPEDSILFQGGCTWRESLLPPSSGSSGSPITFGAYGTGAMPIINGSDIVSTWTAQSGSPILQQSVGSYVATNSTWIHTDAWSAGQFTASSSYTAVEIGAFFNSNTGTAFVGPANAYIYSNNAGVPGTVIATATATIQPTVTASSVEYDWNFSGVSLTNGTVYWFVLYAAVNATNYPAIALAHPGGATVYHVYGTNGTTWTNDSAGYQPQLNIYVTGTNPNVWRATVAATPSQVFNNGARATKGSTLAGLTEGQWLASRTTLYYYESAGNPGSQGYTLEASTRNSPVSWNSKNYVTANGLHVTKANLSDTCIGDLACDNSTSVTGAVLKNSLIDYSFSANVEQVGATTTASILNNEISYGWGNAGVLNVGGIDCDGGSSTAGCLIQGNYLHNNNTASIECDQGASYCVAQYNYVTTSGTVGVVADNHNYALFQYNLIVNNGGYCAYIFSATARTVTGVKFSNNTCYGNTLGGFVTSNNQTNLTVKNNIFSTDGTRKLEMTLGNGTGGFTYTGAVIDYNSYYNTAQANIWSEGTSYYGTSFSSWKSGSGYDSHSQNANPLFTNPSSNIFTLQSGSPAKGTGANLGSPYNLGLLPASSWPANVQTGPQAAAWNMGAYLSTTYVRRLARLR